MDEGHSSSTDFIHNLKIPELDTKNQSTMAVSRVVAMLLVSALFTSNTSPAAAARLLAGATEPFGDSSVSNPINDLYVVEAVFTEGTSLWSSH